MQRSRPERVSTALARAPDRRDRVRHRLARRCAPPPLRKCCDLGLAALGETLEVALLDHVLCPDLPRYEFSIADPAPHCLLGPADAPCGFRDGQHSCITT